LPVISPLSTRRAYIWKEPDKRARTHVHTGIGSISRCFRSSPCFPRRCRRGSRLQVAAPGERDAWRAMRRPVLSRLAGGAGHRMRCKKLIKVIFVLGGLCSMDGIKSVSYDAWARWYEYHMRSSSVQKQIKSRTLPIDRRVYICAEEVAGLIRSTYY
jgi:hypothetical protein